MQIWKDRKHPKVRYNFHSNYKYISMKKYMIILTSLFFITAVIVSLSYASITETKCQSTESEQAIKVVEKFLKWYKENYGKISELSLVDTSGESYSVDLSTCEEYLQLLNNSGYVSHSYIKKWRTYFEKYSEQYKTSLYSDGPPEGFEYDFILNTQEIDETLQSIDDIEILECIIKDDVHQLVKINIMPSVLTFSLAYNPDMGWLIDDIH